MRGCQECIAAAASHDVTRRGLLKAFGLAAATAGAVSAVDTRVAWAQGPWQGDALVVLSLRGGFDGLSAVAPVGDPDYARLRPTIGVPASRGIQLDSMFALHPELAALRPHLQAGRVAIVHAAGMPNPNRSHFAAMDEIERAAPGSGLRTGWLDRALSLHDSSGPFGAVQLGSTSMPMAFAGPNPELGLDRLSQFSLSGPWDAQTHAQWSAALTALHSRAGETLRTSAKVTLDAVGTISSLGEYHPESPYPDSHLGQTLQDVAQLLKADIGARVITVDEGDWDMHTDLGSVDGGWMASKLADLGACLSAFLADLGPLRDQVTVVTMSEFGRRAQENESGGVDHGWGNVMLVCGDNVNGGVHGRWPGLSASQLVDGDVRATTDYRAVLADVLANRCGADTAAIGTILPGWNGASLGITTP